MKQSTAWFFAISVVVLFFVGGATLLFYFIFTNSFGDEETGSGYGDKIAVVELRGVILQSEDVVKQIKKYREDKSIKAILLHIDSPGGGVAASQEIYEEVKKTRKSKPIVVSMSSLAASGGYYVSCGATKIVANRGTLTGSIGVISEFFRFDPLMNKVGVSVNTIKSGKMKDAGNPFREMSPTEKKYFQELMDGVHKQFIAVVEQERKLPHKTVVELSDGRVFTGEQAVELGLIDTTGTYEDAITITAKLAGIKGKPSLVRERKRRPSVFDMVFGEAKISDFLKMKDDILGQPLLQYKMLP